MKPQDTVPQMTREQQDELDRTKAELSDIKDELKRTKSELDDTKFTLEATKQQVSCKHEQKGNFNDTSVLITYIFFYQLDLILDL